jgi:hypothetical protein
MSAGSPGPQPPRLLDQLREAAFTRFGWAEPGERYAEWSRRYIIFHGKHHPRDLGTGDVGRFLEYVAQSEKDPLRCLEHAHEALTFLYKDLLRLNVGELPMPQPPKLLDRVRHAIRVRHYSPRTEDCYVEWAERFIRFHRLRHPSIIAGLVLIRRPRCGPRAGAAAELVVQLAPAFARCCDGRLPTVLVGGTGPF